MDDLSKEIKRMLDESSMKQKKIAKKLNTSLDKVKRVSRLRNLRNAAKENISENEYLKLIDLGFNALTLSTLTRKNDWYGVSEILQNVNEGTTRRELQLLIQALNEKRKRIRVMEDNISSKLNKLEQKEEQLKKAEIEINNTERRILEETSFLKKYDAETRNFFLEHLGLYYGELVLAKRLDSRWQRLLRERKALEYHEDKYIWKVKNLDKIADEYNMRINRKFPTYWDYERESSRDSFFSVPDNPYYKLPTGLAVNFQEKIKEIHNEREEIKREKEKIEEEISTLKGKKPKSFFESVKATDILSPYDLKKHAELQTEVMKWLFKQNYIVNAEITLPNNRRADVIAYNKKNEIIIIEVKVNKYDFQNDEKWTEYLPYCDKFFFCIEGELSPIYNENKHNPSGLIIRQREQIKLVKEYQEENQTNKNYSEKNLLIHHINKNLSRKLIYGY